MARRPASYCWRNRLSIFTLASVLVALFMLLLSMYPTSYGQHFIWMFFPAWAIWVIYALTVLQTLMISCSIFTSEHADQTWELLLLTGISARRILLGACLVSLHRV